jgi:hypothetical protein
MYQGVTFLVAQTMSRKQEGLATEAATTGWKAMGRKRWLCEESRVVEGEDHPINIIIIEGQEDSDAVSLLSAMMVGEDRGLEYSDLGLGEDDEIQGNVDASS